MLGAFYFFVGTLLVATALAVVFWLLTRSAGGSKANKTEPNEDDSTPDTSTPKSREKGGNKEKTTGLHKLGKAILTFWVIMLIVGVVCAIVTFFYSINHPEKPTSTPVVRNAEVGLTAPTLDLSAFRTTPAYKLPPTLTVYRNHEVEIPPASNPAKMKVIFDMKEGDEFRIRAEINGVTTVDCGVFTGIMDAGVKWIPEDSDKERYFIKCRNKDVTTVGLREVWK